MLVGRESELDSLGELIAQVTDGIGGAVWVGGPPGIGKSALIAAALEGAGRAGSRVRSGADGASAPPLQARLDALGGGVSFAAPEGSDAIIPAGVMAGASDRLVASIRRLCAASPLILVVDDAQWADQLSTEVLVRLTRMLSQLPLLLITAARPVPARAEVAALRQALVGAGGHTIDLGPVSDSESAEITRRIIGGTPGPLLGQQLAVAAGNPLYLRELIDSLVRESRLRLETDTVELLGDPADLPASLSAAISLRLGFLSELAMSALRGAVGLGQAFSVADLSTVTGQRASELADAVGEAVQAGILTHSGSGLAFRHEVVHHTLYRGMPASLRAAIHRQAAERLALAGAQVEQVAAQLLASPFEADPWMIGWVADAAPVLSQRAPQMSADLLVRARKVLAPLDARRECLDAELATAQLLLGDYEQVVWLARPMLAVTRDPALAGRFAWTLADALLRLGRVTEAVAEADEALARAELPPVWTARLRALKAMSLFAAGRYDEALPEARQAEAGGYLAGDRLAIGYALYTLAEVEIYQRRNARAAKEVIERALTTVADDPEATDLVLLLTAYLGGVLSGLGMPDAADEVFGRLAGMAGRGTQSCQARVRVLGAVYAVYRGRWDDALAEVEAAARLRLDPAYRQYLPAVMAQIAVHRDDSAAADLSLRGAEDVQLADTEVGILAEFLRVAWALAAERDARPAEALARFLATFATFDPDGTREFTRLGVFGSQWLPDVVRLALAVGEPDIAAAAAQACARDADTQDRPTPRAAALHCRGLLDADPDAVQGAADLFQLIGYPLLRGQALENAAVLHAERGDVQAARSAYLESIDIYRDLGAAWDIIRADSRLRQYKIRRGNRGMRRSGTGWEALTSTEERIAGLIAAGLSNRDIASRMFLSRNTVQTHVSHILTKLGARSRMEVARSIPQPLTELP